MARNSYGIGQLDIYCKLVAIAFVACVMNNTNNGASCHHKSSRVRRIFYAAPLIVSHYLKVRKTI